MSTNNENKTVVNSDEGCNQPKIVISTSQEKGDIDDYIFSWQNVKMVSER